MLRRDWALRAEVPMRMIPKNVKFFHENTISLSSKPYFYDELIPKSGLGWNKFSNLKKLFQKQNRLTKEALIYSTENSPTTLAQSALL
jgi:hypothetical protein